MLFVFEINLVMKLFVQVKIPCEEMHTVILQMANSRVRKQNYRKIIHHLATIFWYMLILYFYLYMQYPAYVIHLYQSFNADPT